VRSRAAEVAAASVRAGGRDSAVLDGADVGLKALDDSPLGRAMAASLAVTAAIPEQVDDWKRAPLQVLARLHSIAARGFEDAETLGRPRQGDDVVDALHAVRPSPAADVPGRLVALAGILTRPTSAPAVLVAAIVHGELMCVQPFRWGSGLIARASVRLVLASRGVDPDLLTCPEGGMVSLGRSSYASALRAYATGEPEGVGEWIAWNAAAIGFGASQQSGHL
jgi:hypothetical protein